MPNRTYAEMEKVIRDHFANISKEEFALALKKANFEYFNQIDSRIVMPKTPDDIDFDAQVTLFSGVCKISIEIPPRLTYDVPLAFHPCWLVSEHSHYKFVPKRDHYKLAA